MSGNKRPYWTNNQGAQQQQKRQKRQQHEHIMNSAAYHTSLYGVPTADATPTFDQQQHQQQRLQHNFGGSVSSFSRRHDGAQQQQQQHDRYLHKGIHTITTTTMHEEQEERLEVLYTCKACNNLEFHTQAALKGHQSSHVQCSDCDFVASKKVVNSHFLANHGKYSGTEAGLKEVAVTIPGCKPQYFSICVGDDPQEIKQWIDERRQKYPTRANVAFKQQQKQQFHKIDNTIVVGCSSAPVLQSPKTDVTSNNALVSLMAGYESSSCSEEEDNNKQQQQQQQQHPIDKKQKLEASSQPSVGVQGLLESSITIAGTATNAITTNDDKNQQQLLNISSNTSTASSRKQICRFFLSSGKCNKGNQCRFLHDGTATTTTNNNKRQHKDGEKQQDKKRNNINTNNGNMNKTTTLLRKLLDGDIRREASLTLQLLRHIVDSNFFQQQQQDKNSSTEEKCLVNVTDDGGSYKLADESFQNAIENTLKDEPI